MNIAPLTIHVSSRRAQAANQTPTASSRNPQHNFSAISNVLSEMCAHAFPHGMTAYDAAARARDAVLLAVKEGCTSVTADLPDAVADQLAKLGFNVERDQALADEDAVGPQFQLENKSSPDLSAALAASRHVLREQPMPVAQLVPIARPVVVAPAMDPQQNLIAIEDLMHKLCRNAHAQGMDSYRAATRARDSVVEAVLEGRTTVTADVPDTIVQALARLGLACRPSARVEPAQQQRVAKNRDGPELAVAVAASAQAPRATPLPQQAAVSNLPAAPKLEFSQQQMADIVAGKGPGGIPSLGYALNVGNAAEVTAFMAGLKGLGLNRQQIAGIVAAKDSDGNPGLRFSQVLGHTAVVTAFMEGLKGLGLNPQQIADIVAAKDSYGIPVLQWALYSGHAAAMTAFMGGLKGLGLDLQQIADIVAAKDSDGNPGLYWVLQEGHAASVTAFMEGLKGLGLNPQQIADIVAAKVSDGIPSLGFALLDGHSDEVTAFMEGLKGLGLNPQQIADIVSAKDPAGTPGLYFALEGGNAAAVTAFMEGLKDLGLNTRQIADIAVAKNSDGEPGLHHARANQHPDTEKAYMDGLRRLQAQNLITAQQIDDIVAASTK